MEKIFDKRLRRSAGENAKPMQTVVFRFKKSIDTSIDRRKMQNKNETKKNQIKLDANTHKDSKNNSRGRAFDAGCKVKAIACIIQTVSKQGKTKQSSIDGQ